MDNNRKNNKQSLKLAVLALLFVASIAIIVKTSTTSKH